MDHFLQAVLDSLDELAVDASAREAIVKGIHEILRSDESSASQRSIVTPQELRSMTLDVFLQCPLVSSRFRSLIPISDQRGGFDEPESVPSIEVQFRQLRLIHNRLISPDVNMHEELAAACLNAARSPEQAIQTDTKEGS